jgi:hypothetical protein
MDPEEYATRAKANGYTVDDLKPLIPYLAWGRRRFGTPAFIPNDNAKVSGLVYNSWSAVDSPAFCRASIFRDFQVLKLGGLLVSHDVSGRNLDFADLDYLTIQGKYHANKQTFIHYSSCRNLTIDRADMAFYEFHNCPMNEFQCVSSRLYSFSFVECDLMESRFEESKLRKVQFDRCGVSFDFVRCDLIDVGYKPPKKTRYYSGIAEIYRQLRIAYQSSGKRHEAAQAYLEERKYERKSFFNPYFSPDQKFPPMAHEMITEIWDHWRGNTYTGRAAIQHLRKALFFYFRVWTSPKYAFSALGFKFR